MAETKTRKRRPRPDGAPPRTPAQVYRLEQVRVIVLAALLAGNTQTATAELAGVSRDVVKQCLADPEFRTELEENRSDLLRAVVNRVAVEGLKSLDALVAFRDGEDVPYPSRVRSAVEVLRLMTGATQIEINQTTIVGGHGGPDPAEQLRTFLGKLQQRSEDLAGALPAAPIDVESTET
jgi:hypothetical protein